MFYKTEMGQEIRDFYNTFPFLLTEKWKGLQDKHFRLYGCLRLERAAVMVEKICVSSVPNVNRPPQ